MAFVFTTLLQLLVEEVIVETALTVTAVTTAAYVAGRAGDALADRMNERTRVSSPSTSGFYLGEKTIFDWWEHGITYQERQRLLNLGYDDKRGCFELQELKEILCLADKEPGKPTEKDGYKSPKNWDGKLKKAPNSQKKGYPDEDGNVWVPTGRDTDNVKQHGGPHWDVQLRNGDHRNVRPQK
jgi:hypothetical protein